MTQTGIAEALIENEIGCGPFQIVIVFFLFALVKIPAMTTFVYMSYGNYNPGWRCLDNLTHITHPNDTALPDVSPLGTNTTLDYRTDLSCAAFEACHLVEFNPESSTVVTEWNLLCDRAWIPSLMISLQMAGNLVGSSISGQLADTVGRKKTLYGSLFLNAILTFVSIFSTSWQMFTASRFFIGMLSAFFEALNYVYPAEFLTKRWRSPLAGIPGWSIGGILFGTTAMLLRDWRHLLVAIAAVSIVTCIPAVWIPESLRWLEVKDKKKEFKKVVGKMARLNGVTDKNLDFDSCTLENSKVERRVDTKKYTLLDLFHPGYRRISVCISVVWLTTSLIFYAIGFGVKALSGNFYLNLIAIYSFLLPCAVFPAFAPNILGRRLTGVVFALICAASLLGATAFEMFLGGSARIVGTLIFVMIAEIGVDTTWTTQQVHLSELYPTVVRGLAINGASLMARFGGIVAPFIIPNDTETVYVWYLTMACLSVFSAALISRLPETKGKPLKETFEDQGGVTVIVNREGGTRCDKHDIEGV